MNYVIIIILSYLLGSISFSFLMGKLLKGIDIRQHGSGNAGATNTLRVLGTGPGIAVLLMDIGKGVLAVWIGKWLGADPMWGAILGGVSAIIGHNWPVFFSFKGGKGIATTIGVVVTICFYPSLIAGGIALIAVAITRYVSLGSLLFTTLLPIVLLIFNYHALIIWMSLLFALFAIYRHRTNISKLISGQENKLGSGKTISK